MRRLPKGKTAQVMGSRFFQTMYTANQMQKYADKAVSDEREARKRDIEELLPDADRGDCAAAIRART